MVPAADHGVRAAQFDHLVVFDEAIDGHFAAQGLGRQPMRRDRHAELSRQMGHAADVIGVQVRACAPYANVPPADGPIVTLADGIAVKWPGEVTRPVVQRYVDDIVVVEEDSVADAMVLLMDRSKLYVEGGGAVGVSAIVLSGSST